MPEGADMRTGRWCLSPETSKKVTEILYRSSLCLCWFSSQTSADGGAGHAVTFRSSPKLILPNCGRLQHRVKIKTGYGGR